MKKVNTKLAKGLGAALLLVGANMALAETVTVPATVTVNNAIDFTFTGTLDFGQIRATASIVVDECTGLVMPANPASPLTAAVPAACADGAGTSVIQAVGGTPTRPAFTIAGTAPFTTLTLTVPNTNVPLSAATGPGTPQFFLSEFTAYRTGGTPGAIALVAGVGTFQTNATGGATFSVGASLATHLAVATTANYQDLAYSGSFDVEVTY